MKKVKTLAVMLTVFVIAMFLFSACGSEDPPVQPAATPSAPDATQAPTPTPPTVFDEIAPIEEDVQFADSIYVVTDGTALSVMNPFSPATSPTASRQAFIMIFDRLVNPAGDGEFAPSLATSWDTDDFQTITMTLRQGVYFQNGDSFTSADVIATVEAAHEGLGSMAHDVWRSVETVTAIDAHTVQFVLDDVNVEFLFNLSQIHASILSARAIAESETNLDALWTAGTGAYRVVSLSPNDVIVFERNDDFWGELPITRTQTWFTIPELATRTLMMLNGEANLNWSISRDDVPMFEEHPDFLVVHHYNNNPHYISFNMNDPITGCLYFRRAVAHAVYKPDLAFIAGGVTGVAIDSPNLFGFASAFKNTDIPPIPHDLARAREYLAASAWNGETIVISTAIPTNIRPAEVLQMQLAQIGLDVSLNVMDVPGFTSTVTYRDNQSQMAVYLMPTTLSAAHMRNGFFPGSALNRASYNNPYVTELLDRALRTIDTNERRELYMYIQEVVSADMPYIPIFFNHGLIIVTNGFGGIGYSPVGDHDLRFAFQIVE